LSQYLTKAKGVPLRNLLGLMIFILLTQTLQASSLFKEYTTQILSVDGRFATIKDSDDIFLGSSGIVTHKFDEETKTIVARVDVIEKKDGIAKIRFDVYKYSAQSAFPIPGILPSIGDNVTLNYLYDRSLLIAPNYDVYKEITTHFKGVQWVHPDLAGAYLAREFKPNPDREDFQEICRANVTSLIFFALDYNGYFVDCNNFRVIKEYKGSAIKKVQHPFYTRVPGIESSWLKWGSGDIGNYSQHYRNLIRN
jgi:hypothetical protein